MSRTLSFVVPSGSLTLGNLELCTDVVVGVLGPLQSRYEELARDPGHLDQVLAHGAQKAHELAAPTVRRARRRSVCYQPERPTPGISLAYAAEPRHPRCVAALPEEMLRHYAAVDESSRIKRGLPQLELLRTQELVRRFLPRGILDIADIGGGAGVHAEWLAEDGHRVHLVDPVPGHVATARALSPKAGSIDAQLGDALSLPFRDASMDAVLILGPMYHLTEEQDRIAALREGLRVARPGAPLFVAAISRFASLFDGLGSKAIFDPEFRAIVEQDLRDGQHRNPTENPQWFTTTYFHHPDQLRAEATDAGVEVDHVLGLEGITESLRVLSDDWEIPERRETIIWAARQIEAEPTLSGLSAHLLLVGHRPS